LGLSDRPAVDHRNTQFDVRVEPYLRCGYRDRRNAVGRSGTLLEMPDGLSCRPWLLKRTSEVDEGEKMERRVLGGTGISVSGFALGTMMLGAMGNTDRDESVRMIHAALDAGINFVDTADVYSRGESEEIVGKALGGGRRDNVVLATKFGLPVGGDPNRQGASPLWVNRAVDASLRRLGTDYIDIYQLHRPDYSTDLDETLGALSDLIRAGKVRAIGSSTFPADLIVEAQWVAERRGHHRFRTEQPRYSILTRTIEGTVLPAAQRHGMGVLSYGPLSSGWLSGRADPTQGHRTTTAPQAFDLNIPANRAKLEAVGALSELATEAGLPLTHLATAFVRSHPAVTSVIIGPRTPEQLDDLLAGADVVLGNDLLDRIDEIVAPGSELNPEDNYLASSPAVADPRLRRRT
jgi:aryl-alcohol dehydrogenase-like predicted oxidoreductase